MTTEATGSEVVVTATPVAATVTPTPVAATPEVKVDPKTAPVVETNAETPHDYGTIENDPGLTMALGFVGKLGLGPNHPAIQEALKGNFDYVKAHLASMGPKAAGWEQHIALAEKSYAGHVTAEADKITKAHTEITKAVGGEEAWGEIQTWAAANAEPAEKAEVNKMLNAGGLQSRAAALLLQSLYQNAAGTVVEPRDAATTVPANGGSNASTALSPEAYQAEVGKLTRIMGASAFGNSPEYKSLQARRAAYHG